LLPGNCYPFHEKRKFGKDHFSVFEEWGAGTVRKVTIMIRFKRGGKFVMKRAQHAANGKLVPRRAVGMHSEIEGACRYYLRYRLTDGRRVYDPVGKSSIEVLAAANRKEIELFAALRSAEVGAPNSPQVPAARVQVDNAIGQYLSNFASQDQRTTFLAYRRAIDIFREVCTCEYVDQITMECVRSFVARLRGEFDQDTVYHRYHYVEFFLGKLGKNNRRVVSLQILDDQRSGRIGDGSAERLAHLGDFGFPGSRRQRRLHGDVASAVAQTAEARGFGAAFSFRQFRRILRIDGDPVDGIVGERGGSGLLELAERGRRIIPLFDLSEEKVQLLGRSRASRREARRSSVSPIAREFLLSLSGANGVILTLDPVPEITAGIPDALVDLRVSRAVGCARGESVAAGSFRGPREFPGAEGIAPKVLTESRELPRSQSVNRDVNLRHTTMTAEGDAAHLNGHPRRNFRIAVG